MDETPGYRCDDVLASLDDFLDQEQPPEATRRLMVHLEGCPECAARCEAAYRELAALREGAQRIRAPSGLMERIARALAR
jgi:anti-sigma factor (TIGR02949 family)